MTACTHTPKYPDLALVPSYEECFSHCKLLDDAPEEVAQQRALTSADGTTTQIDNSYWSGLSVAQRAAVVAHERAHPQIGMEVSCEGCADKVGGYFMRAWGYAPSTVHVTFGSLRVARKLGHGNIADNAEAGAKAAEQSLAGRGLLGLPGDVTSTRLAQERAAILAKRQAAASSGTTATQPAGTGTAPLTPVASPTPLAPEPSGTAAQASPPSSDAPRLAGEPANSRDPGGPAFLPGQTGNQPGFDGFAPGFEPKPAPDTGGIAGDVVSAVLGEQARPHAGKVLIAAGIAATLAVVLVIVVRRVSK